MPQRGTWWSDGCDGAAEDGSRGVALEHGGYSAGARPLGVEAYTLWNLLADVVAMLGALGSDVQLAGHDWGGVVGWRVGVVQLKVRDAVVRAEALSAFVRRHLRKPNGCRLEVARVFMNSDAAADEHVSSTDCSAVIPNPSCSISGSRKGVAPTPVFGLVDPASRQPFRGYVLGRGSRRNRRGC